MPKRASQPDRNPYEVLMCEDTQDSASQDEKVNGGLDAHDHQNTDSESSSLSSVPESDLQDDTHSAPLAQSVFWKRLSSLPIVQDGWTKVHDLASQNTISRIALQQAEVTLSRASEFASPLAQKYRTHLYKADALGCSSLDFIEKTFPVVCQPTSDVVDAVKGKLTTPTALSQWLQPQSTEETQDPRLRYRRLAADVKHHLGEHLPKTDLAPLTDTRALLQESAIRVSKASARLQEFVAASKNVAGERMHSLQHSLKDSYISTQSAANHKLQELTVDLVHCIDHASEYLMQHSSKLPPFIQERLQPVIANVGEKYHTLRAEALRDDVHPLQKAAQLIQLTQSYIFPIISFSIKVEMHPTSEPVVDHNNNNNIQTDTSIHA